MIINGREYLGKITRNLYIISTSFDLCSYAFFPILLNFMPKYSNALTSMNLIALAVLMNANSSGYSTLLISKIKNEHQLLYQ